MGPSPPMENIWEISDDLWEKIKPVLLAADPPKATGRKRVDQRLMLNGVVYKMRSGYPWNLLPKELGDDSTIHRAFQRWVRLGVFAQVWAMVEEGQRSDGEAGPGTDMMELIKGSKPLKTRVGRSRIRRVS